MDGPSRIKEERGPMEILLYYFYPLYNAPKRDLELLLDSQAFLSEKHPNLEVDLLENNLHITSLRYNKN